MMMLKNLALALFGWIPIGERFVRDGTEYIAICIKERGAQPEMLPPAASLALAQLAYARASERDKKRIPRWRNYVLEMEAVSDAVVVALNCGDLGDTRIRNILAYHRVI